VFPFWTLSPLAHQKLRHQFNINIIAAESEYGGRNFARREKQSE
jgi:hypothetical protein